MSEPEPAPKPNFLKVGARAGAETKSFGSTTMLIARKIKKTLQPEVDKLLTNV
jgi:hypothetical protein